LNHFADIGGQEGGIILSNADCYFMRLGSSTVDQLDTCKPQISVLAGGQVDGPKLGIPAQGGDTFFRQRFALKTRNEYDPAAAMRFALEHQNPLVAAVVTGDPDMKTGYPGKMYSFLELSNPNVLLWALKPAEEGIQQGVIARVWNLADRAVDYQLSFTGGVTKALKVTHIETDLQLARLRNGVLIAKAERQQLQTHRLFIGAQ
jgi:alpha-mannosidase